MLVYARRVISSFKQPFESEGRSMIPFVPLGPFLDGAAHVVEVGLLLVYAV